MDQRTHSTLNTLLILLVALLQFLLGGIQQTARVKALEARLEEAEQQLEEFQKQLPL
ncbi:MAG: hypothetical protein ABI947_12860 [Chloroflexota bacterium]